MSFLKPFKLFQSRKKTSFLGLPVDFAGSFLGQTLTQQSPPEPYLRGRPGQRTDFSSFPVKVRSFETDREKRCEGDIMTKTSLEGTPGWWSLHCDSGDRNDRALRGGKVREGLGISSLLIMHVGRRCTGPTFFLPHEPVTSHGVTGTNPRTPGPELLHRTSDLKFGLWENNAIPDQ
ncbi:hypothetical protein DPSP01_012519 [Paraphaeosphaeria sporulosa]